MKKIFIIIFLLKLIFAYDNLTCSSAIWVSNDANSSFSKEFIYKDLYVGNKGGVYFKFKTSVSGILTVSQQTLKNKYGYKKHKILAGESCNNFSIKRKGSTKDLVEIQIDPNKTYVIKIQEANMNNYLNVKVDFNFEPEYLQPSSDDICYNDLQFSGNCFGMGPCAFGVGCRKIYPLKVKKNLKNIKIYYNEDGLSGSFSDSCGADPDGSCKSAHSIDFGPFGFLNNAVEFDFNSLNSGISADIWVENLVNMQCFYSDRLYISYEKDGKIYKGKLRHCEESLDKYRDFELRNPKNTRNIKGNIKFIGNTVLEGDDQGYLTNTDIDLSYVDTDNDPDTFNSSAALLNIPDPENSTIVWAGLYTQGYLQGITDVSKVYSLLLDSDYPLYLTVPKLGRLKVVPSVIDYARNIKNGKVYGYTYNTFTEIKALEGKKASEVNGWITAANIKCFEGKDNSGLGNFGAWTLVVIYKNKNEKLRNISVFDGYKKVSLNDNPVVNINVKGFLTPYHGEINSTLSLFVGEGDKYITGDQLFVNGVSINTKNAFNSSITGFERNPSILNNQGIDIQNHNISTVIKNGETNATITLKTHKDSNGNADTYFPSVVAFTTNLYEPRVCYYIQRIYDDNNQTYFENGKFVKDIDPLKNYNIKLFIANMPNNKDDKNIETAQKVQVYMNLNEFNYTLNSTYIKNIDDYLYTKMTDMPNDDLAVFYVDKNESEWHLGVGADTTQGGTIEPSFTFDDKNKAYIIFKGKFIVENNQTNLDLENYLNFKASFATEGIEIPPQNALEIPQCKQFNTSTGLVLPKGEFVVANSYNNQNILPSDTGDNIYKLKTAVVNRDFNITVIKVKNDHITPQTYTGIIKVDLIKTPANYFINSDIKTKKYLCNTAVVLDTKFVYFKNQSNKNVIFKYNLASKDTMIRVSYLTYNNMIFSWPDCDYTKLSCIWDALKIYGNNVPCKNVCYPAQNSNVNKCLQCLFAGSFRKSSCSYDDFAIRPYKFTITSPLKEKAGTSFNVKILALDFNGNKVSNYNTFITLNGKSPYISASENKNGCITGSLYGNSLAFINGEANVSLIYTEAGYVKLKISEKDGSEFANIDKNDTPVNQRMIKSAEENISFIPDHFDITGVYSNYKKGKFTYISDDLNMSSELDLNITAKNAMNAVTKNYNRLCYAKNTDLNISYSKKGEINTLLLVKLAANTENRDKNFTINGVINEINLSKDIFDMLNRGSANIKILINYKKDYTNPSGEVKTTIKDINISDSDGVFGNKDLEQNAVFRYGKIAIKDISAFGNEANTTFTYEYWDNIKGWVINSDHNESMYGDINKSKSIIPSGINIFNLGNIINGEQNITIKTDHILPYVTKIHLSIPSWLWYHPSAKGYKDPDSSNLNCLTHPCMRIEFRKENKGWGGVGTDTQKYKETNRTVEFNTSASKIKANKNEVNRLNW